MAAKGTRMTGHGSWFTAFKTSGEPSCTAALVVQDTEIIRLTKQTVKNITWTAMAVAVILVGLAIASHSIPL